jgi:hypothetical protein
MFNSRKRLIVPTRGGMYLQMGTFSVSLKNKKFSQQNELDILKKLRYSLSLLMNKKLSKNIVGGCLLLGMVNVYGNRLNKDSLDSESAKTADSQSASAEDRHEAYSPEKIARINGALFLFQKALEWSRQHSDQMSPEESANRLAIVQYYHANLGKEIAAGN